MATETKPLTPAEHLERRIAMLDTEVEQIRAEFGDPAAALGMYLVERFGIEAMMETYREYLDHEDSFLYDDWHADPEDDDGGERP